MRKHASSVYLKTGVSLVILCVNFVVLLAQDITVPALEGGTLALHTNVSQANENLLFVWIQNTQFRTEGGLPFCYGTLHGAECKQNADITVLKNIHLNDSIQSSLIFHTISQNEWAYYWLEVYQLDVYDLSFSKIETVMTNQRFIYKSNIFYVRVDNLPGKPKCVSNWTGSEINGKGLIKCVFDRTKPTATATLRTGSTTIATTSFDYTKEDGKQNGLNATVEENDGPFRCELTSSADPHFKESCEFDVKERATTKPPSRPIVTRKASKNDKNHFPLCEIIFIVVCCLAILIGAGICYYRENKPETEVQAPSDNGYHQAPTANGKHQNANTVEGAV